MKTPGVYIVEKSAFPNSVVEAATAIPAFIGITEKVQNGPDSLSGKPWKITSMTEFQQYFGGAPSPVFTLSVGEAPAEDEKVLFSIPSSDGTKALKVADTENPFSLYYNMVMFFANGGGTCYIVSVGTYAEGAPVDKEKVVAALAALEKEQEIKFDNPRKFACYCGVAPFEYTSGTSIRGKTRTSKLAAKDLKALLTRAAITAMVHDPQIKSYYARKVAEGKHKASVINAIRAKIIYRCFAVVKRQTPYVKLMA